MFGFLCLKGCLENKENIWFLLHVLFYLYYTRVAMILFSYNSHPSMRKKKKAQQRPSSSLLCLSMAYVQI